MQHQVSTELGPKLTTWAKEPSLLNLKQDLEQAKPFHDAAIGNINRWNDLNKVTGSAKPKTRANRSSVQPKLIRRQAEWRYSALSEPFLSHHKMFEVRPVSAEDAKAAQQNELVLNYQFRTKLDRVKFIDDYVRTDVDEGTAIVKLGWKRKIIQVDQEVPVWTYLEITSEEDAQLLQQALESRQLDPRTFDEQAPPELKAAVDYYLETETPTVARQTGTTKAKVDKIIENRPTLQVMAPGNVYIDPSCEGDIDKAMFAVISFETNKADLLKDTARYKNLDKVDWDNLGPVNEPDHETKTPSDFTMHDKSRKKVVAYEYWGFYDINDDGTLVPIVATWIGDTLIRMEENPFPDEKIPLVVVTYLPKKRELYGETDAELLEDNQAIMGALSRGLIDLMGRSANAQQGFAKGMLDPFNRRKYDQGQDYEFNPNMNPQAGGLIEHKYPEIPASAMAMLQLQNQEAEALTGVKSFGGGLSGDAYGDVAAGVRGMLDAASKREMSILRRLAGGMEKIGSKIASMNAVFLSEEEVIRITNEEFVTVKREDLKGNFDFVVDISTAEIDDAQAKDLAFMLQTIGNNMDHGMRVLILSEIARLKRMPDLAKRLENYQPEPDPVQQKLQELAIKKAELEIAELDSKIKLNEAKAAEAEASAGQKELDTHEQATGTTHGRELERQQAQSQGNQDLQVTKAITAPPKEGQGKPDIEAAIGFNEFSKARREQADRAPPLVDNTLQRDELAREDMRFNLGSRFYEPGLDPATNPNLRI